MADIDLKAITDPVEKRRVLKQLYADGVSRTFLAAELGVSLQWIDVLVSDKKQKTGHRPTGTISASTAAKKAKNMRRHQASVPPEQRTRNASLGGQAILQTRGREYYAEMGRKSAAKRALNQ